MRRVKPTRVLLPEDCIITFTLTAPHPHKGTGNDKGAAFIHCLCNYVFIYVKLRKEGYFLKYAFLSRGITTNDTDDTLQRMYNFIREGHGFIILTVVIRENGKIGNVKFGLQ